MANIKTTKRDGVKKVTSIGMGSRSRSISKNKSHTKRAKAYRGQGR